LVLGQFKGPIAEVASEIFEDLLKKEFEGIPENKLYID
jgi:hypothetical protein